LFLTEIREGIRCVGQALQDHIAGQVASAAFGPECGVQTELMDGFGEPEAVVDAHQPDVLQRGGSKSGGVVGGVHRQTSVKK